VTSDLTPTTGSSQTTAPSGQSIDATINRQNYQALSLQVRPFTPRSHSVAAHLMGISWVSGIVMEHMHFPVIY
jgi:hypothetical protein